MHIQAKLFHVLAKFRTRSAGALAGLLLFIATCVGEFLIAATCRWLLVYVVVFIVGIFVSVPVHGGVLAWAGALAPLVNSVFGLLVPGSGIFWRRGLGARLPVEDELERFADALNLLQIDPEEFDRRFDWFVVDEPMQNAEFRGRVLLVSRGLMESESLAAVLAHELGHMNSLDGRLRGALARLKLWGDPMAPLEDVTDRIDSVEDVVVAFIWGAVRIVLRLAGGGTAHWMLSPLWALHWRRQEFAADAYAADLGQAEDLAQFLTDYGLPLDLPQRFLFFNLNDHPPVATRVERLLAATRVEESSSGD